MRVLTLSHVDASWIKQRPHFIAEELHARGHRVLFAYARAYRRTMLVDTTMACRTLPLVVVPNKLRRIRVLRWADELMQSALAVVLAMAHRPEVVWVCSPRLEHLAMVLRRLTRAKIVYDYMDRNSAFDDADTSVLDAEHRLLERADLVTCSSATLLQDVAAKCPEQRRHLTRNALSDPSRWEYREGPANRSPEQLVLGYAGTISSWFDFDVLRAALDKNPQWRARLWGPVDVDVQPHGRMALEGVLSHSALPEALHQCDVLIMPFRLTPLIEAVDPVKAYEYVATGRGVVLPLYSETAHFEPYADRFVPGDADSFINAVMAAKARPLPQEVSSFVGLNTWEARVAELGSVWEGEK